MYLLEFAGEDDRFAAAEAGAAAPDASVLGPGVGAAAAVDADRARSLAFTRRVDLRVASSEAAVEAARTALSAAALDRSGSVAVRARDVRGTTGVDTRAAERALGDVLVDRGYAVDLEDPDHELRALFAGERCHLGWLHAVGVRGYGARRPTDRPFFQPGSMAPQLARALVNLARAAPGERLLDPMCGTGGVLIEAGLVGARPLGLDAQRKMVRGTRENLRAFLDGDWAVGRGDATRLPVRDGGVDAVVFDAPYGRQSKVANHLLPDLVGSALAEARRVAARAVVVADRRLDRAAADAGWRVDAAFDRPVHRSLTRHVHVLAPADDAPGPVG
ncbi:MAG: methyltransferase domain-containing protein [Halobacteriaceae archaeon]